MATNIGDLAVRIGADTTKLESGFASAIRTVNQFSLSATSQLRSVTNQAVKMGAAATAAGVAMTAALYTRQSEIIDALAKTSDALGVTTQELQAMHHIAELNGVSTEAMNKALKKMEVNLGAAARSGGTAANALEDIGINIDELMQLSPDEQLEKLSAAIVNVESQSKKASIANDVFGKSGLEMLKVMENIKNDGLDPTIGALEDYGIAISRVDAAKVEQANDAFLEVQKTIEGISNQITIALAPYVTELASRFNDASSEAGGFGNQVENALRQAIHFAGQFADMMRGIHVVFKGVELAAYGLGTAIVSVFEGVSIGVAAFVDDALGMVNVLIEGLNKIPKVEIDLIDSTFNSDFMQAVMGTSQAARDNVARLAEELDALAMKEMPSTEVEEFLSKVGGIKADKNIEEEDNKETDEDGNTVNLAAPIVDTTETDQEIYARKENALRDHLKSMYDINADAYDGIQGIIQEKWGLAEGATAGAMKDMLGTMSTGSRKAFEINKAWAMTDAAISMYQGIAAGLKLGWPMAIPAVAYAASTGLAQINSIKSQSFGSGSTSSAASTSAAAPSETAQAESGGSSAATGSSSTLTVSPIDPNAIFSGSAMQSFGEQLYDFTKDGGKVVFG